MYTEPIPTLPQFFQNQPHERQFLGTFNIYLSFKTQFKTYLRPKSKKKVILF